MSVTPPEGGEEKMVLDLDAIVAAATPIATETLTKHKGSGGEAEELRRSTRRKVNPRDPKTTLRASPGSKSEGVCGYFLRGRTLYVEDARKPGVIVQKVTRNFTNVELYNLESGKWALAPMADADIDDYVKSPHSISQPYATVHQYWELWKVSKEGIVADGEDQFSMCAILPYGLTEADAANTTKGTFTVSGEMSYYEAPGDTLDVTGLGFAENEDHPAAKLLHRDSAPPLDAQGFKQVGKTVMCTVTVTWDSGLEGKEYSTVIVT